MKKIERLRYIKKTFGSEFVVEYFYCETWKEIEKAILHFKTKKQGWGLRTDSSDSTTKEQGYLYPFLFKGSYEEAKKIWDMNKEKLYYIVCENIPSVLCHGVALYLEEDSIFIEFNREEQTISQRQMYDHPENVRRIGVGPSKYIFYNNTLIRCFPPEQVQPLGFDKLYKLIMEKKEKMIGNEITFSIKLNKQIVIW